jgi:membrane-associated phospholipid phosphatase
MLVDTRRGLWISGALLAGGIAIGLLLAVPATRPAVEVVDHEVWEFAVAVENTPTTTVAVVLSWLGSGLVNWPLRGLAVVFLAWKRYWVRLTAFLLAILTSELFIGPVKALYDRPRPPDSLITTTAASFPSGHAVSTAVTAVGLVLVLAHPGPERWRWEVRAVVFTGIMALSRVYLRAHWLSDTVAGALVGAGLALGWPALLMTFRGEMATRNT